MSMSLLETGNLLVIVGLVANGLLLTMALVQGIRRDFQQPGWFSAILFAVSVIGLLGSLFLEAFWGGLNPQPTVVFFLAGLISIFSGLILIGIERRKGAFATSGSFGLLLGSLGGLALFSALLVPVLPGQLSPPSQAGSPTAVVVEPSVLPTLDATSTPQPTASPTSTPSPTRVPSVTPQPTATPTRERYSTRTPTATPIVTDFCGAIVNYNLNMRANASADGDILIVIPFESIIDVGGQSVDGDWWFVEYNGVWGWIDGEYVTADVRCDDAPVLLD